MNKTELVAAIAEKAGISKKDADAAVAAFVATVTDAMKAGDKVALVGFGTFEARERAARTGVNPKTKETIQIAATKVPAFKAGQALKNVVAK
ncbi:MAG: HU family DNA-binding protein [Clostridia bacterium]|nr:HU family DNA-binding protein [Clostridia bacterium]